MFLKRCLKIKRWHDKNDDTFKLIFLLLFVPAFVVIIFIGVFCHLKGAPPSWFSVLFFVVPMGFASLCLLVASGIKQYYFIKFCHIFKETPFSYHQASQTVVHKVLVQYALEHRRRKSRFWHMHNLAEFFDFELMPNWKDYLPLDSVKDVAS